MAAGEDQPKPVVLDALIVQRGDVPGVGVESLGDVCLRSVEPGSPPHRVNCLETSRRDEPRPGIGGHAFLLPLLQRRPEGIVQRIFGEVEVAEKADQGRQDPS